MRKINRRNFLKVTGVLAAASALAACGGSSTLLPPAPPAAPPVPLPAQTVQRLTTS